MGGYVDLSEKPLAQPAMVLRCHECGHDVGVHGRVDGLSPDTYMCIDCRVAQALEPKVGRHLKAVA